MCVVLCRKWHIWRTGVWGSWFKNRCNLYLRIPFDFHLPTTLTCMSLRFFPITRLCIIACVIFSRVKKKKGPWFHAVKELYFVFCSVKSVKTRLSWSNESVCRSRRLLVGMSSNAASEVPWEIYTYYTLPDDMRFMFKGDIDVFSKWTMYQCQLWSCAGRVRSWKQPKGDNVGHKREPIII